MYAKHQGKHTLRAQCTQNTQEISGDGFSGQLPHSHIGELKCMQNMKENTLSDSNVCKTLGKSQVTEIPASYRTAI